jgi:hypothetical protein
LLLETGLIAGPENFLGDLTRLLVDGCAGVGIERLSTGKPARRRRGDRRGALVDQAMVAIVARDHCIHALGVRELLVMAATDDLLAHLRKERRVLPWPVVRLRLILDQLDLVRGHHLANDFVVGQLCNGVGTDDATGRPCTHEDIPADDPRCLGQHGNYHHNYPAKLTAAGFKKTDTKGGFRLTNIEDLFFDVLWKQLYDAGGEAPPELGLPRGTRVVHRAIVSKAYKESSIPQDGAQVVSENTVKSRWDRSAQKLRKFNVIGFKEPYFWWTGKPVLGKPATQAQRSLLDDIDEPGPFRDDYEFPE